MGDRSRLINPEPAQQSSPLNLPGWLLKEPDYGVNVKTFAGRATTAGPEEILRKESARCIAKALKKRRERRELERIRASTEQPDEILNEVTPVVTLEKLLECDPEYKAKNRSFWEVPSTRLLQLYTAYIHQHKLTLELSLLNGVGYKFMFESRKWEPKLLTVKTFETKPGRDTKYWIQYLSKVFYQSRFRPTHLRRLAKRIVLGNWSVYKYAVKCTYQGYVTFFNAYNPTDPRENVQSEARWEYESLHYDAYLDFSLLEIALLCHEFKVALTVIEATIDGRFYLRRQNQVNCDGKKSLHIWAREYIDTNSGYSKYFLTPLIPMPCDSNEDGYNSLPNGELRLTYVNNRMNQYRLTQTECTRSGMAENWGCLEWRSQIRRTKNEGRLFLLPATESSSTTPREKKRKSKIDKGSKNKMESRRSVQFHPCVKVQFYKAEEQQQSRIFLFIKWLLGIEVAWLKTKPPTHVRDCRHVPLGQFENFELNEPKTSSMVPKSILKKRVDDDLFSREANFYEETGPIKYRQESIRTPFHDQVPYNFFEEP